MRTAARTDANQSEIVSALTDAYFNVAYTYQIGGGFPDTVVSGPMPCPCCQKKIRQNLLVEIKVPGGKLTKDQQVFHKTWNGPIVVVETIDDALRAVGVLK